MTVSKRLRRALMLGAVSCIALDASASTTSLALGDAQTGTSDLATTLNFPLTRGLDLGFDVALRYHPIDGSAVGGSDYVAGPYRAVLAAGASQPLIGVGVLAHPANGASTTFQLAVDGAVGIAAAPSFGAPTDVAAGDAPIVLASADINGDGIADLVTAGAGGMSVSVLLGATPAGAAAPAFAAPQSFDVDPGPIAIGIGDFNGDGKPDLAVVTHVTDSVNVLLNTTVTGSNSVTFATPVTIPVAHEPAAIAVADMNGDGRLDLVVGPGGTGNTEIVLGTTAPGAAVASFAAAQATSADPEPGVYALAVADFTGDGVPDIATASASDFGVSVRRNVTSPGSMTIAMEATAARSQVDGGPAGLVAVDVNGDGRLDLATANLGGGVSLLVNIGAPGQAPSFAQAYTPPDLQGMVALAAGDLNGDGKPDLVAVGDAGVLLLRNASGPGAEAEDAGVATIPLGVPAAAVALVDVDGDGRLDLVAAQPNVDTAAVFLNTTPAPTAAIGFATQQNWTTSAQPLRVAAGDLNGDGKPDLVAGDVAADAFSVRLDTTAAGATTAAFAADAPVSTLDAPTALALADLDGDGRLDVIVSNQTGGQVSVFLNTTPAGASTASFATRQDFPTGTTPDDIAIADFNGDGRLDLATMSGSDKSVSLLINTAPPGAGSVAFAAPQTLSLGGNYAQLTALLARDVNGDGRSDLVVFGGGIGLLINLTPAGAGSASFQIPATPLPSVGARLCGIADLNGDGRPDFLLITSFGIDTAARVVINTTPAGASVGTGSEATAFAVDGGRDIALADVDGDGRVDLVASGTGAGKISVRRNTTVPGATTPTFAAEQPFGNAASGGDRLILADLNADGRADAVVVDRSANTLSTLLATQYRVTLPATAATGTLVHDFLFAGRFD